MECRSHPLTEVLNVNHGGLGLLLGGFVRLGNDGLLLDALGSRDSRL